MKGELKAPEPLYKEFEDAALDGNELRSHCRLDNGRHSLHPKHDLERLDTLPAEILTTVLAQLDLQSLTVFRRVNQRALQSINTIPHYQTVIDHASMSLRAMLSTDTAQYTTIEDLYNKLCKPACESCLQFGGLLYLITCKRICSKCLSRNTSYFPIVRADVVEQFCLRPKHIEKIPRMLSRSGFYENRGSYQRQVTLYDHDFARAAGIAFHGSEQKMLQHAADTAERQRVRYVEKMDAYDKQENGRLPLPPRYIQRIQGLSSNHYRYRAIISIPYFNMQTGTTDLGFCCSGCRQEDEDDDGNEVSRLDSNRLFTMAEFADHVKQWGPIKHGFHIRSPSASHSAAEAIAEANQASADAHAREEGPH